MELGLGVLALRPNDFWNLSLIEWRALEAGWRERHGIPTSASALPRAAFDDLMRRYPDRD